MSRLLYASLICALMLMSAPANASDSLVGDVRLAPNENDSERIGDLYRGDLGPEIGVGCSNNSGTTGGPNDAAVCLNFERPMPVHITSHYYHVFTQVSPTITALTFKVWENGSSGVPGVELYVQPGMDFSPGAGRIVADLHVLNHSLAESVHDLAPFVRLGVRD